MTSSTRIRARSFGSLPDRIRLLITLSEIEPTGWPLCMTGIWENFQWRISSTAVARGIFASTYWTFLVWICSTSAFFSCRLSSAWRDVITRRTTSYEGFIFFFSIFTIVDWLTFESRASAVCVSPRAFRRRGASSKSGSIWTGNGHAVHIPAGIFMTIAYYWLMDRGQEGGVLPQAPPTARTPATKAIYAPPHPRRTAGGGFPWREISKSN